MDQPPRNNNDWAPPAWAKDFFDPPVDVVSNQEEEERATGIITNIPGYNYRDYSTYIEDGGAMKKHKKSHNNFPARLHKILSDEQYSHIILWMPHGRAWKVHNKRLFVEEVIPKYFGQSKFNSFTRQLSAWAFTRLQKLGPDNGCYYHEHFLRGHPRLTVLMRRLSKTGKSRDPPDVLMEPDFYAIDKEYPLQTCEESASSSLETQQEEEEEVKSTTAELNDNYDPFKALIDDLSLSQSPVLFEFENPASNKKEMQDICNAQDETRKITLSATTTTTNHHNSDATGIQFPNPIVGNRVHHQGDIGNQQYSELHHVQYLDPTDIRSSFEHDTFGIYRDSVDTNLYDKYQFMPTGQHRRVFSASSIPLNAPDVAEDSAQTQIEQNCRYAPFQEKSIRSSPQDVDSKTDEEKFVKITTRYK